MRNKIGSRRTLVLRVIGVLALGLVVLGPTPAPVAAQAASGITSPSTGSSISNDVPVRGTAVIEPFQKYELYFKREPSGDDAYIWFAGGTTPVVDGQLGVWAASGLEPGVYSLRLRVVKNDGNYAEYFARDLSVNQGPQPTDTPEETAEPTEPTETPIPTATFTPAPQPTPAVGQVTQPQVVDPPTVAAVGGAAAPTDTPTPEAVAISDAGAAADTASNADSSVIVNPDNAAVGVEAESSSMTRQLGEALSIERLRTHFFNGMRYSAALFLVIGLIFLGKRILVWVRTQV